MAPRFEEVVPTPKFALNISSVALPRVPQLNISSVSSRLYELTRNTTFDVQFDPRATYILLFGVFLFAVNAVLTEVLARRFIKKHV